MGASTGVWSCNRAFSNALCWRTFRKRNGLSWLLFLCLQPALSASPSHSKVLSLGDFIWPPEFRLCGKEPFPLKRVAQCRLEYSGMSTLVSLRGMLNGKPPNNQPNKMAFSVGVMQGIFTTVAP